MPIFETDAARKKGDKKDYDIVGRSVGGHRSKEGREEGRKGNEQTCDWEVGTDSGGEKERERRRGVKKGHLHKVIFHITIQRRPTTTTFAARLERGEISLCTLAVWREEGV